MIEQLHTIERLDRVAESAKKGLRPRKPTEKFRVANRWSRALPPGRRQAGAIGTRHHSVVRQLDLDPLDHILRCLPELAFDLGEEECFRRLRRVLRDLSLQRFALGASDEARQKEIFQERFRPIFRESEFARHCIDRPRGSAGDFVTREMILLGRTGGDAHRYIGTTERGRLLSAFAFDLEICRASESRIDRVHGLLREAGPRVASIGCGSCTEFDASGALLQEGSDVLLIDQDVGALEYAKRRIGDPAGKNFRFEHADILKMAIQNPIATIGKRDLIYLLDICDYISVENLALILKSLRDCLHPGGAIVATNTHPRNPNRFWMEYGANWHLDHKNEKTMFDIGAAVPEVAEVTLESDDFGLYQFLTVRAKG